MILSILDGGPYTVPGLSGVITTSDNSAAVLSTEGTIVTEDGAIGDNIRVAVRLLVDGVVVQQRRYDVERGNFNNSAHWSFGMSKELPAGDHTVTVEVMLLNVGRVNAANPFPAAIVAGPAASWSQSTLTAVVVNK